MSCLGSGGGMIHAEAAPCVHVQPFVGLNQEEEDRPLWLEEATWVEGEVEATWVEGVEVEVTWVEEEEEEVFVDSVESTSEFVGAYVTHRTRRVFLLRDDVFLVRPLQ